MRGGGACLHQYTALELLYPLFSLEKKGILISYQSLSIRESVRFLVNVSPPKLLDIVTSNFVDE